MLYAEIHSTVKSDYNAGKIKFNPKFSEFLPERCVTTSRSCFLHEALETLAHVENGVEKPNLVRLVECKDWHKYPFASALSRENIDQFEVTLAKVSLLTIEKE